MNLRPAEAPVACFAQLSRLRRAAANDLTSVYPGKKQRHCLPVYQPTVYHDGTERSIRRRSKKLTSNAIPMIVAPSNPKKKSGNLEEMAWQFSQGFHSFFKRI
jgi:hypothetical protein